MAQAEVHKRVAFYQKLAATQGAGAAPAALAPKAPAPKNGDGPSTVKSVTSG
jgi:hypothetical protein